MNNTSKCWTESNVWMRQFFAIRIPANRSRYMNVLLDFIGFLFDLRGKTVFNLLEMLLLQNAHADVNFRWFFSVFAFRFSIDSRFDSQSQNCIISIRSRKLRFIISYSIYCWRMLDMHTKATFKQWNIFEIVRFRIFPLKRFLYKIFTQNLNLFFEHLLRDKIDTDSYKVDTYKQYFFGQNRNKSNKSKSILSILFLFWHEFQK